ncbi:MAG TPA: Mrp/NBP35 family ATP-binding protein [Vicinamibacterales bacterium]|nr:Mrp/NBP35 family ATP-binding protein [Vicinamibacterales bacterium]HOQ60319.1 Mrp/NBP35 family ATP-binding protein [Vicinamibacterales bacterium]HPK71796.1 Mrp/NBP35 family ATP-binding protein [Vicinamibacterales bacterium]HPW20328.1 Mrp/NBP35 family ATP-binding protein [Vicinamibacterales bacterium]
MALDQAQVLRALASVKDPDLHKDIVSLGFVKDVAIDGGRVSCTIELTTPACPVKDQMKEQARAAVMALPGVSSVDVTMTARVRTAASPDADRTHVPGVKNVIAVGAGKGGVGKTTVAVNLALALAAAGSRVGLMDADIYGPNVPIMLGLSGPLASDDGKIVPPEKHGLRVVSIGFLTSDESPLIWRGPMLHSVIRQFLLDVHWGELDYLVVDLPPGTGDVALSLSQTAHIAGAIAVTSPQRVAVADTRRAVVMYQKLGISVLGLVENMSYFVCPSCRHESDIFGRGGGQRLAEEMGIPFLGGIPISERLREGADAGAPLVIADPSSPVAKAFASVAEQTAAQVSIQSYRSAVIPLKPVS